MSKSSIKLKKGKTPLGTARHVRVSVGVHEDRMADAHEGGLTIGELATIHEFGAPKAGIPARSVVRDWFDSNLKEARQILRMATNAASGDLERAGAMAAQRMGASMQERIAARIPPPLKPATVKAKGSDVPLIDQGILRSSYVGRSEVVS